MQQFCVFTSVFCDKLLLFLYLVICCGSFCILHFYYLSFCILDFWYYLCLCILTSNMISICLVYQLIWFQNVYSTIWYIYQFLLLLLYLVISCCYFCIWLYVVVAFVSYTLIVVVYLVLCCSDIYQLVYCNTNHTYKWKRNRNASGCLYYIQIRLLLFVLLYFDF